ncbi:unnamed protein product [Effrenium voratum]|nr:unnamed protein product [Effrenium voratum]
MEARPWLDAFTAIQELRRGRAQFRAYDFNALALPSRSPGWRESLQVLKVLEGIQVHPDKATLHSSIRSCRSRWRRGLEVFAKLRRKGLVPTLIGCNSMISTWAQERSWQHAQVVLTEHMAGVVQADVISFNTLARAQWGSAIDTFGSMLCSGVRADVISYNCLLSISGVREKTTRISEGWAGAVHRFGSLQRSLVRLSAVSFGSAIKSLEDNWFLALDVMRAMRSEAVDSNVIVYGSAIASCETRAIWRPALQLLQGHAPSAISFNSGAAAARAAWRLSLSLLAALGLAGLRRSEQTSGTQLAALGEAALWRRAVQQGGSGVVCSSSVISACENSSQWLRACAQLAVMSTQQVSPNVLSFSSALSACHWRRALEFLGAMELRRVAPNEVSFTGAVGACEKAVR